MSCETITKSGTPCKRKAISNNKCVQHNRCQAITKTGRRCMRKATVDGMCTQHGRLTVNQPNNLVTTDC